jgi:hypothetical protein
VVPEDLLAEVDRLVGERGRSAFLTDLIRREVQRQHLLTALRDARGCWKTEDHPELKNGLEESVDSLRRENDGRFRRRHDARDDATSIVDQIVVIVSEL